MKTWLWLEREAIGRLSFPVSNFLFNRPGILRQYRRLLKTQYVSPDELREVQLARLKQRLSEAGTYVPYYRELFRRIGFRPAELRELDQLKELPPLTRKELVEHRLELVDERCRTTAEAADRAGRPPAEPVFLARFRGERLIRNTSSGSTGAPTVFYEDGSITGCSWANELRLRSWFGVSPGAREARMARVSADYLRHSKAVVMRRWLWNQLALPGISLTEADYACCVRELERFRPRVLWGFTSALTGLAEFVLRTRQGRHEIRPDVVITWAAPMQEHEERVLQEAFGCPATNIYGAREVGHVGARCPAGTLHLNQESLLVETEPVGDLGDSAAGEILVTTLMPTPMPFIRYRMGDLGVLAPSRCACGRTLHVLQEFTGRTGEVFVTSDGRMISPNFWCRTFMDPKLGSAVERFQIAYRPGDVIVVRIVRGSSWSAGLAAQLQSTITRNLQGSAHVEFEYPEAIAPLLSGKYQMVVKESMDTQPRHEAARCDAA